MRAGCERRGFDTALVALTLVAGCDGSAGPPPDTDRSVPFAPRAVTELRDLGLGDVWFSVAIGGELVVGRADITGAATTLELAPGAFGGGERRVDVEFFLDASDGAIRALARGSQSVSPSPVDGRVELAGLFYDYVDSDGDGLFDVHELAESFADADELAPVDDPDSDDDGLRDGDDPTPYGAGSTDGVPSVAELAIESGAGTEVIDIERILGGREETRRLAATGTSLELGAPAGWPFGSVRSVLDDTFWTAYEPGAGADGLCPDWRIDVDATSFSSSLSDQALLVFRREEVTAAFAAPVSAGTVEDLDVFEHAGPNDGDGPWNDALRAILVRAGTVGWIELYTERGQGGRACRINLSTR